MFDTNSENYDAQPMRQPDQDRWNANYTRRMDLINEEKNRCFAQQHYAALNTNVLADVLASMNRLAMFSHGDCNTNVQLVSSAALWGAARVMPALFELLRRNRWQRTYSIDEILAVCAQQHKRVANQLKRPKAPYIRKRDKIMPNPAPDQCDGDQPMRLAVLTLVKCGWLLCTDDFRFEISPKAASTSYAEYTERYASNTGMMARRFSKCDWRLQLGLSPRTVEFLAYLGYTQPMDFWRIMAILWLMGMLGQEATYGDWKRLDQYHALFALTPKQERTNIKRGMNRNAARYWVDRYTQRGWLGHRVKHTPIKLCGFLGDGGTMREEVIHDCSIPADRFDTEAFWIMNPSIAVCFEFTEDDFYTKVGRYFKRAYCMLNAALDFLGIFKLRHKRHMRFMRSKHHGDWNWDKYFGPRFHAVRPKVFRDMQERFRKLVDAIGMNIFAAEANPELAVVLYRC